MAQIEKIRKEIERLKEETFDSKELSLEEIIAVRNCYNNLIFFIDSLEQPIKRTSADIEAAMQEVEEKSILFTEAHKDDVVSNDTISNPLEISRHVDSHIGETLEEASVNYAATGLFLPNGKKMIDFQVEKAFKAGAQWQKDHTYFAGRTETIEEIKEVLLSEVLPCFMHGGEADEVVAKLDEVLNQK